MNNPKLEPDKFPLGKPVIVSFTSATPVSEGEGKWGHWELFNVIVENSEFSYFPPRGILGLLKPFLDRGITTLAVERVVEDGPRGPITRWFVSDPHAGATPTNTPLQRFEADMNRDTMKTRIAEKDAQIARAVALKAGIDFHANNANKTIEDVLGTAQELEKWLLRDS